MWLPQPPSFGIERNGEPIESHQVRHGVNPNIVMARVLPGLVPIYEEQEALRYANYNYIEWKGLSWEEKALHVAHHRLAKLIELHGQDAVNDRIDKDMKEVRRKR